MPRKKNNLSVFDKAFAESGFSNTERTEEVTDMDNIDIFGTSTDIDNLVDENDPVESQEPTEDVQEHTEDPYEDHSEIPESVLNNIDDTPENKEPEEQGLSDEITEPNENEKVQIRAFFDAFADSLHWDVEENDKPDSIESLIDYIQDVVDQNSTPDYADDRIQQLDNYVRNGGKFEDFYKDMSQTISYSDMDMEDESNQKAVVREYLKLSGYNDDQISRKIERYEDADVLVEEAEDAVYRLKEIKQAQLEEQQRLQELYRQQQEQQAIKFAQDLNNSIVNLSNIRGISVPKEDRKALFDYITRTDSNGLTQYQKDFNANMVNNLIESAYFTMKGDTLITEAKKSGQTSAANKLRQMLRHQSKNHSTYNVQEEKHSVADIASKWL